jgi:hypothetical protein
LYDEAGVTCFTSQAYMALTVGDRKMHLDAVCDVARDKKTLACESVNVDGVKAADRCAKCASVVVSDGGACSFDMAHGR